MMTMMSTLICCIRDGCGNLWCDLARHSVAEYELFES